MWCLKTNKKRVDTDYVEKSWNWKFFCSSAVSKNALVINIPQTICYIIFKITPFRWMSWFCSTLVKQPDVIWKSICWTCGWGKHQYYYNIICYSELNTVTGLLQRCEVGGNGIIAGMGGWAIQGHEGRRWILSARWPLSSFFFNNPVHC